MNTQQQKRFFSVRRITILAFLLVIIFLTGQASSQEGKTGLTSSVYYKRGVRFYKQGEYENAIREFQRVLVLDPSHVKAERYLEAAKKKKTKKTIHRFYDEAKNYYKQQEYQKAIEAYNKVLEIAPEDGYALHNITVLKARIEKIEQRKSESEKKTFDQLTKETVEKKAHLQKAIFKEGVRFYKQGEYNKAIREFQKILEQTKDHKKAKHYLQASQKKKNKKIIDQLYDDAHAYEAEKDYQKAVSAYHQILEIAEDAGLSLYEIEVLKARIEKIEWLAGQPRPKIAEFEIAKKEPIEEKEIETKPIRQQRPQQIPEIKEDVRKVTLPQRRRKEQSLDMEMALMEIEAAMSQKGKRISELIASIPPKVIDKEFSLLKGISEQEKIRQIKLTYNNAKQYYKRKKYSMALEAFQQVIILEKNMSKKRYTPHAQRYINKVKEQLKKTMKKELLEQEAKGIHF